MATSYGKPPVFGKTIGYQKLDFYLNFADPKSYPGGSTVTSRTNSWVGTFTNGPTVGSDGGGSVEFDGTDDWIDNTSNNTTIANYERTQPFSVEWWGYKQAGSGFDWVIGRSGPGSTYRGWGVVYRSSPQNTYSFGITNTSGTNTMAARTTNAHATDVWIHHCITYDGSSAFSGLKMYQNGVEQPMTLFNDSLSATTQIAGRELAIGRRHWESANYYKGKFGLFRIWLKELNKSEIDTLFDNDRARFGV
jgi:hypothetical protein